MVHFQDHLAVNHLRVAQRLIYVVDRGDADFLVLEEIPPFIPVLCKEDLGQFPDSMVLLLGRGTIIRNEILSSNGLAKILPELKLPAGKDKIFPVLAPIYVAPGR